MCSISRWLRGKWVSLTRAEQTPCSSLAMTSERTRRTHSTPPRHTTHARLACAFLAGPRLSSPQSTCGEDPRIYNQLACPPNHAWCLRENSFDDGVQTAVIVHWHGARALPAIPRAHFSRWRRRQSGAPVLACIRARCLACRARCAALLCSSIVRVPACHVSAGRSWVQAPAGSNRSSSECIAGG